MVPRRGSNTAKWVELSGLAGTLGVLASCSSGCAATLSMDAEGAGGPPHTTVPYTGVRNDAARFEDYSVIDGSILDPSLEDEEDARWPWR